MIQTKKKGKVLAFLILFLLITPLTIFYILDGTGIFDTRGRAAFVWEECEYSKADLNLDKKVDMSDFSIWLKSFRDFKVNPRSDVLMADLTNSGSVDMADFSLWLSIWRQYKACQEGIRKGDTSKCLAGCSSPVITDPTTPPVQSESTFTKEEFQLNQQQVALYYPSDTTGKPNTSSAPFPVVVFHHGMASKYSYYLWLAEDLASKGYLVVMPNRPMTEMDMEAGAKLTTDVLTYLDGRNNSSEDKLYKLIDKENLIVSGHSLGAGLSLFATESLGSQIKGLVLLASGGSVSFAQTIQIPGMDAMQESFERMRNIAQTTNVPIMYIIGSKDKIINPEGTKELYGLTNSKKVIAIIEGGNHVQFVQGGAIETQIMRYLDAQATISAEEQRNITLKYFTAWLDYIIKEDGNAKKVLEAGKSEVPVPLSLYDFSL